MTQPAQQPTPTLSRTMPAAAIVLLLSSLLLWEGTKSTPYRDIAGVWTVCKGITGPDVIPGKRYSREECERLESHYVDKMAQRISHCIHTPLSTWEWVAWGHFSYNVGTTAFCRSSAARLLNAGDRAGACRQITRWTFVAGKDCRIAANRCSGIVKRRQAERQMCERGL